jgi:hypothetical protein
MLARLQIDKRRRDAIDADHIRDPVHLHSSMSARVLIAGLVPRRPPPLRDSREACPDGEYPLLLVKLLSS